MSHKTFRRRFLFSLRLHYVIFFFLTVLYISVKILKTPILVLIYKRNSLLYRL